MSCGGADKCIMQWKHLKNETAGEGEVASSDTNAGEIDKHFETLGLDDISLDGPGGGDESGAVKPWLGAVRAPSSAPPVNSSALRRQNEIVLDPRIHCWEPLQRAHEQQFILLC